MSRRVEKTPRAKADLIDQFEFIGRENPDAAERFLDAAEAAFEELARMPKMGALREYLNPGLSGLRMWRIHGFKRRLIFYRPTKDGIEVVRVLHSSRDIAAVLEDEPSKRRAMRIPTSASKKSRFIFCQ